MNLRRAGTITLTGLLMLGGAAVFAIWYRALGAFVLDDTFISLRYASHLAAGHGLVYNVGERVEGYTNFLWTARVRRPKTSEGPATQHAGRPAMPAAPVRSGREVTRSTAPSAAGRSGSE